MPRTMGEAEAENFVIRLLQERGRLTTRQIEEAARERESECPDATVRFLNKLRLSGKIKGEISMEERGWVWHL
ncbi:MAG: hypothetical protein CVT47_04160 [Thermoplasmata archaeon HGW-Thermoplasmata-2]|nr:MAG: hypothetical protein CVT47_04160 [Thermoplasmata archaeon HGW-Thermoplasmata-2]